jgi:hypothetical protein
MKWEWDMSICEFWWWMESEKYNRPMVISLMIEWNIYRIVNPCTYATDMRADLNLYRPAKKLYDYAVASCRTSLTSERPRLHAIRLTMKLFQSCFLSFGAEIWGCAGKSNISIIQRSQWKILRMIANAPWYVPNITLHEDLNVPLVKEVIKQRSTRCHNKIGHVSVLIQPLLEPHNERRLKRNWPPT